MIAHREEEIWAPVAVEIADPLECGKRVSRLTGRIELLPLVAVLEDDPQALESTIRGAELGQDAEDAAPIANVAGVGGVISLPNE